MYAILIPALNESIKIEQIVHECLELTSKVVVVDDGSSDDTEIIAKKAGALVLRNERTLGLGGALHNGLDFLFNNDIKTVVTIDGDGAHSSIIIPEMVSFHKKMGADITIGSRLLNHERSNDFPSPKRSANKLGALLMKYFCNISLSDVASGMRVVSSKYTTLPKLAMGYGFTFELLCSASEMGFNLLDYPIDVRYDARQFFATRDSEILGLLKSIQKFLHDEKLIEQVTSLIDRESAQETPGKENTEKASDYSNRCRRRIHCFKKRIPKLYIETAS